MAGRKISELFYELRAKTEGLKGDLDTSERQLQKFATFVKNNPTAVVGALATALVGVGIAATRMAEEVSASVRRIAVNLPEGAQGVTALKDAIASVSSETGRLDEETRGLFETISKQGVSSAQEIETRARTIEKFADATNSDRLADAAGLDQLMDAFQITADGAENALAKIASVSQGRAGVQDVLEALQGAAPAIAKYKLDFETTIKALIGIMDTEGRSAAQAGKLLKSLDSEGIREYATRATIAADATQQLNDRANVAREGLDRLSNKTKNELNRAMVDLGEKILPLVVKEMQGIAGILDLIDGTVGKITAKTSLGTLGTLGAQKSLSSSDRARLREAYEDIPANIANGSLDLKTFSTAELQGFYKDLLKTVQTFGDENDKVFHGILTNTAALIAERKRLETPAPSSGTGAAGGGTRPLTIEEKAALAAAAEKAKAASETVRKIFAEIGVAAEEQIAGTTVTAFDNAMAALNRFVADAVTKRTELVAALKTSGVGKSDQAGALDAFDLQVNLGRTQRTIAAQSVLEKEQAAIQADFQATLAALTGDAIAAMRLAQDAVLAAAKERGASPEQLAQIKDLQEQLRTATIAAEEVDGALARLRQSAANGLKPLAEMRELSKQELILKDTKAGLDGKATKNAEALKLIDEKLAAIEARRAELAGQNADRLEQQAAAAAAVESTTHKVASALEGAANVGYGLVQALNLGDTSLGRMVTSVGQMASGLAKISGKGGFGALSTLEKFSSIGSIVGGAISLGRTVFGDKEDEALRKNTEALLELTNKAGLLGESLLGGRTGLTAIGVAQRLKANGIDTAKGSRLSPVSIAGLSDTELAAFRKAAEEFGVTLDYSGESYRRAVNAILDAAGKLGEFGDDYQSRLKQFEAYRKIFNQDDPVSRLGAIKAAADSASPALSGLFDGITNLTDPESLALLTKRVQDLFHVMELGGGKLTKEQLGELGGDELVQALEQIIAEIGNLTPKVKSVGEKLAAARSDLATEFDILSEDAATQLRRLGEVYGAGGGALADLFRGLDASSAEGALILRQRIEALFKTLQDPGNTVDLAGLSLQELIAALLDLKHGADAVAGGIVSAAEKMQAAVDALKTDFEVFGTDSVGQAEGLAGLYSGVGGIGGALGGIDLKSSSGRAAAIAALQALYASDKGNTAQTAAIVELLRALRAVPEEVAVAAAKAGGGGGSAQLQTSGAEKITIQQADRLLSLTESILIFGRKVAENTDPLRSLAALLRPPAYAPISAPAAPSAFAAAGGVQNTFRISITLQLDSDTLARGASAAESFGQQIGSGLRDSLDQAFGAQLRGARLVLGNPVAGTS